MVEVNFTVELGLPVGRSATREAMLCEIQCVAQSESPGSDLDVYVILLEGWGENQQEHRIFVNPKGWLQKHRIIQVMVDEIWAKALSEDVATRLQEQWAEVSSEERAMARRWPRRAENVGAL